LYSAQLETIHTQIPEHSMSSLDDDGTDETKTVQADKNKNKVFSVPKIAVSNLRRALEQSRPSVSRVERDRYNKIYQAFKGDRTADFDAVSGFPDGKLRTALK